MHSWTAKFEERRPTGAYTVHAAQAILVVVLLYSSGYRGEIFDGSHPLFLVRCFAKQGSRLTTDVPKEVTDTKEHARDLGLCLCSCLAQGLIS